MSYNDRSGNTRDLTDTLMEFLSGVAKFLLGVGLLAILVGAGFLFYSLIATAQGSQAVQDQAEKNIGILSTFLNVGMFSAGVGAGFLFWGEEILGPILLIIAAIFYTAPMYGSAVTNNPSEAGVVALQALQRGGLIMGIIAIAVTVADISFRIRDRMTLGSKKDVIKLGKEVKAEPLNQNVILGKCWQMPFCRKYVREKCPIFHAKRTCWKEGVGCMCEEAIIGNALKGQTFGKGDLVAAAAMIPRNSKLTAGQKLERCKSCVIYNEHQKHKYKVSVPVVIVGYAVLYLGLRVALVPKVQEMITKVGSGVKTLTFSGHNAVEAPVWLAEFFVFAIFMLGFSYTMKLVEYLFFTAKV